LTKGLQIQSGWINAEGTKVSMSWETSETYLIETMRLWLYNWMHWSTTFWVAIQHEYLGDLRDAYLGLNIIYIHIIKNKSPISVKLQLFDFISDSNLQCKLKNSFSNMKIININKILSCYPSDLISIKHLESRFKHERGIHEHENKR